MTPETVQVVTDGGTSIRPEYPEAKESGIVIIPLDVKFYENGEWVAYPDSEISPEEFYRKMRQTEKLPQTSGAISGRICEAYLRLAEKTNSIISIHITSEHSAAWSTAFLGANLAKKEVPELLIEVIDSRQATLGTWFLAELAAKLSQDGATLEQIKQEVLATIPKIELLATLSTLGNIIKGGRVPFLAGYLGEALDIKPILTIVDGEIQEAGKVRTVERARQEMVNRIEDKAEIVRMAIFHANDLEAAKEVQEALAEFYLKEIPVYEAGPILGVHTGEGAVGVVFQKA